MSLKKSFASGAPCWSDLSSSDLPRAKTFYASLFGWTYDEAGAEKYGGYINALKDGQRVAGLSPHAPEYGGVPNVWSLYMGTADAVATGKAVAEAGGKVLVPPMHVAPFGYMAVFEDATAAGVGAWQPEEHHGFGRVNEAGAPCWYELYARDYAAARAFYEKAFGWKLSVMSDTPEFRYVTFGEGNAAQAGIMDASRMLGAQEPSHWVTYWGSADVDADCAKIKSLGGAVLSAPEDSPHGRLAAVADPCGARFKLVSV